MWNQQIEATIGLLGEVGSFGNVLGDIGKAVVAILHWRLFRRSRPGRRIAAIGQQHPVVWAR